MKSLFCKSTLISRSWTILFVFTLCLVIVSTSFAGSVGISGTLSTSDSDIKGAYVSIGCNLLNWAIPLYADTYNFIVTETGSYTFRVTDLTGYTGDDIAFSVYSKPFNINDPKLSCLGVGVGPVGTSLKVTLTANTEYVFMVRTSGLGGEVGPYQFRASGPGDIYVGGAGEGQPIFLDGRVNDFDTGNPVVLFGINEGDDQWGLEVYNADQTGVLFYVTAVQIASVPTCPESNTLIYADDATGISLWRLTQRTTTVEGAAICPFQLNAPTGEAYKVYIIIFYELYPNTYYESWEEFIGN